MKTFLFLALLSCSLPAAAYIGPGAAIGLVGYFFGGIGMVVAVVLMALYYPVRVVWKKWKARQNAK